MRRWRAAITMVVCALREELEKLLPGAAIFWSVGAGVAVFDFAAMSEGQPRCVDLWMIMDYCLCRDLNKPIGDRANADIRSIAGVHQHYTGFNVPMNHVGIIFPWFGCDFLCADATCATVIPGHGTDRLGPWDDGPGAMIGACGSGEYAGPGYAEVLLLDANGTDSPPGWLLDEPTYTRHFHWSDGQRRTHDVVSYQFFGSPFSVLNRSFFPAASLS